MVEILEVGIDNSDGSVDVDVNFLLGVWDDMFWVAAGAWGVDRVVDDTADPEDDWRDEFEFILWCDDEDAVRAMIYFYVFSSSV